MASEDQIVNKEFLECNELFKAALAKGPEESLSELKACRNKIDSILTHLKGKKRDIMPLLQACITRLMDMSADAAQLEYVDNSEASKRLKADIAKLKNTELQQLTEAVLDMRSEIRNRGTREYKRSKS